MRKIILLMIGMFFLLVSFVSATNVTDIWSANIQMDNTCVDAAAGGTDIVRRTLINNSFINGSAERIRVGFMPSVTSGSEFTNCSITESDTNIWDSVDSTWTALTFDGSYTSGNVTSFIWSDNVTFDIDQSKHYNIVCVFVGDGRCGWLGGGAGDVNAKYSLTVPDVTIKDWGAVGTENDDIQSMQVIQAISIAPMSVGFNYPNKSVNTTYSNYNGWINVTTDTNASCAINDTRWIINSSSNVTHIYTFWYSDYISLADNQYSVVANCTSAIESIQSTVWWAIDTTAPNATSNIENNNTYWTAFLLLQINASDNIALGSLTINDSCGYGYSNSSITSPFQYNESLNITGCSLGQQTTNVTICDNAPNCISYSWTWGSMGRLNITATDFLTNVNISYFSILQNGTLRGNTTIGYFHLDNLTLGYHNISIDNTSYELKSAIIYINQTYDNYSFLLYTTNSFNISFYKSSDKSLLSGVNVTIDFIGSTTQTNITDTGYLYVDLFVPDEYTFVFYADGYRRNQYITTLSNRSHQDIKLYLNNESLTSLVLIEVKDKFGNSLTGVDITIQRYSNAWITEQIVRTDFQGRTEGSFVLSTVYYNFILEYLGVVEFGSPNNEINKKLIYAEDVTNGLIFTIDILGTSLLTGYQETYDVYTIMEYINQSNTTGYFRFHYNDADNQQWTACLEVTKGGNNEIVCACANNTVTSESSTLTCSINQSSGRATYTARGFLTVNPPILAGMIIKVLGADVRLDWGVTGYIVGFFIVLISFFIFLNVPTLSVLFGTGVFVILTGMGLMFKDMGYGVLILIMVISYFVATIKSESGLNA